MKITKSRLKEIIKEEVEKVFKEGLEDSEEEVDETMDSGYVPEPKNKKDEDK
tara:strand:+ start:670 stop:825 length:156 start_codon:yes stop_codon:yes gene_type:complete